jgi:hypothetical protein
MSPEIYMLVGFGVIVVIALGGFFILNGMSKRFDEQHRSKPR